MEFSCLTVKCRVELERPISSASICVTMSQGQDSSFEIIPQLSLSLFPLFSSKFSDPLKTNTTGFQQANTRNVLLLFLPLHSQSVSFSIYLQLPIKWPGHWYYQNIHLFLWHFFQVSSENFTTLQDV